MSDLVSRQNAIDEIDKYIDKFDCIDENFLDGLKTTKKILNDLPSAQSERPKGRWIEISRYHHSYKCSLCGRMLINITDGKNNVAKHYPFCHCGADMREKQNENI